MKFVDQVRIQVKAGNGGNGAVAFRREKYIERGGPSGGDGGNGGSVIFVADPQLTTLLDYRYQQHHFAQNGQGGLGSDCNGAASEDMILRVPCGTLIKDLPTGELLADLNEPGQQYVAAKGGRGGLGNMNFATSTRQTPRFAQDGTQGEERKLQLELKLLADVGLLGFPNAGKSTLISRVSRARPKVADYPFTTLVPNLGVVGYKDDLSFVMADIPGLIEGAHEGVGLGLQFLRHVERCKVLIHVVDLSAEGEGREPLKDWNILNHELAEFSPGLAKRPQIVAANKMDLPFAAEKFAKFKAAINKKGFWVYPISSATGEGVPALIDAAARVLFGTGLPPLKPETFDREPKKATRKAPAKKAVPAKAAKRSAAAPKAAAAKKAAPATRTTGREKPGPRKVSKPKRFSSDRKPGPTKKKPVAKKAKPKVRRSR